MSGASPWSVKGITAEERELAKEAARRAGVPIGQWLSRQIRDAAQQERAGGRGSARPAAMQPEPQPPIGPTAAAWRNALGAGEYHPPPPPSTPPAIRPALPSRAVASPESGRGRDLERRPAADVHELEGRLAALEAVERRLAGLATELGRVSARLEGVEKRVDARLGAVARDLADFGTEVETLRQRASADGPASGGSTAPIERAVMRLAERLQRVEALTLPEERAGRGILGRLFRR